MSRTPVRDRFKGVGSIYDRRNNPFYPSNRVSKKSSWTRVSPCLVKSCHPTESEAPHLHQTDSPTPPPPQTSDLKFIDGMQSMVYLPAGQVFVHEVHTLPGPREVDVQVFDVQGLDRPTSVASERPRRGIDKFFTISERGLTSPPPLTASLPPCIPLAVHC